MIEIQADSGKLLATILETRESTHVGDLFHCVFPGGASVGDEIVLGEGVLFFEDGSVGVKPRDGRDAQWLDIHSLYKCHEQTVVLEFEKDCDKGAGE